LQTSAAELICCQFWAEMNPENTKKKEIIKIVFIVIVVGLRFKNISKLTL
jgi:hypothetical protein